MQTKLIEAGAGCGKTYRIVSHYLQCLGVDPESGKSLPINPSSKNHYSAHEILTVTFTELASREMKERIVDRLNSFGRQDLSQSVLKDGKICTFHSYCYTLSLPFLDKYDYKQNHIIPSTVARANREDFIIEFLRSYPEIEKILEFVNLGELVQICLNQWHRKESTFNPELLFSEWESHFEEFKNKQLQELKSIASGQEITDQHWLWSYQNSLENPSFNPKINFRKEAGFKVSKEFPLFYENAKSYRDFLSNSSSLLFISDELKSSYLESLTKISQLLATFSQCKKIPQLDPKDFVRKL